MDSFLHSAKKGIMWYGCLIAPQTIFQLYCVREFRWRKQKYRGENHSTSSHYFEFYLAPVIAPSAFMHIPKKWQLPLYCLSFNFDIGQNNEICY
jgi:hypothetical protein